MAEHIQTTRMPVVQTFTTGANRDVDTGKHDYEGFFDPLVLERYGRYMHKHRKLPDGSLRDSDNWQKGIPLKNYMKSLWRHFLDLWRWHRDVPPATQLVGAGITEPFDVEDMLCAIIFNAMGYLHELIKKKRLLGVDSLKRRPE